MDFEPRTSFGFRHSTFGFLTSLSKSLCPLHTGLLQPCPMESPNEPKPEIHSEAFLRQLMRRQLRLSIACAVTFLIALLGLPLLNYFFPELMATRVFGFTLRSEEHTSELQSLAYLVCRLLLEKK